MKSLPDAVVAYKRTPEFSATTVPAALLRAHNTKPGVWARIVVIEGQLLYRILEPGIEELQLSPGIDGVIEPQVLHEVALSPDTRFYVEFLREPRP